MVQKPLCEKYKVILEKLNFQNRHTYFNFCFLLQVIFFLQFHSVVIVISYAVSKNSEYHITNFYYFGRKLNIEVSIFPNLNDKTLIWHMSMGTVF